MSDIQLPNREKERNKNENRGRKDLFSIIEEFSSISYEYYSNKQKWVVSICLVEPDYVK